MSVQTTENMDVIISKRSWRTEFNTGEGEPYSVTSYQEETKRKDGEVTPFAKMRKKNVSRIILEADGTPTAVAAETVTLADGTIIAMGQILEAGSLFSDKWRAEDEAAESFPAE